MAGAVAIAADRGQRTITQAIEKRAAESLHQGVDDDRAPLEFLQRTVRYHNVTGRHSSSKFTSLASFMPGDWTNAATRFLLQQHADLPLDLEKNIEPHLARAVAEAGALHPAKCPCCDQVWRRTHTLGCSCAGRKERYAKNDMLNTKKCKKHSSLSLDTSEQGFARVHPTRRRGARSAPGPPADVCRGARSAPGPPVDVCRTSSVSSA